MWYNFFFRYNIELKILKENIKIILRNVFFRLWKKSMKIIFLIEILRNNFYIMFIICIYVSVFFNFEFDLK